MKTKENYKCNKIAAFKYWYNNQWLYRCSEHITDIEKAADKLNVDPNITSIEDKNFYCNKYTGERL